MDETRDITEARRRFDERADGVARGDIHVATLTSYPALPMALRAAPNRRLDAHREWMIRSYVLTWTFAGCRAAGTVTALATLGDPGGAAIIWVSWVVPLLACECILQWPSTRRSSERPAPSSPDW
jgi:hypothetical protein